MSTPEPSVSGPQETLFFPLLGSARAAGLWPDIFPDPWARQAEQIAREEGTTAQDMGRFPALVYGLRHQITLVEIRRYLAEHPGAAVVNVGCGLDRLRPELDDVLGDPDDDTSSTVYNLDFPEVLEMRSRWIERVPGEVDLPHSVTDHAWMEQVGSERGMIAIAAGVFYYLEVDDVRALVAAMAECFPGGRLAYDSESPMMIRGSERAVRSKGVDAAPMPFKVKRPEEVAEWSDRVSHVRVEGDFTRYVSTDQRRQLPRLARGGFAVAKALGNIGMYEVVVDFAEPN